MTNPPSFRRAQGLFQRVGTFVVNTRAVTLVVHTPDGNASEVPSETVKPMHIVETSRNPMCLDSVSKPVPHSQTRRDSNPQPGPC